MDKSSFKWVFKKSFFGYHIFKLETQVWWFGYLKESQRLSNFISKGDYLA